MEKRSPALLARLLQRTGYVPAARVRELSAALEGAEQRSADIKRALDEARQTCEQLKIKLREYAERTERAQRERSEAASKYEERVARLDQKTARELERIREHDVARSARIDDVRQRVGRAEKASQLGREHLMAIEVKLDLVENAINVLDQRTRAALAVGEQRTDPTRDTRVRMGPPPDTC